MVLIISSLLKLTSSCVSGAALMDFCGLQQKPLGTCFYGLFIIRRNCHCRDDTG